MLNRRQTLRNAVLTAGQVVVSAVFLFAVYRYLLVKLGPAQLGVWSIVMAISTVARISDLGFAGGMTRFVAKYRALNRPGTVRTVVETGAISLTSIVTITLAIAYPVVTLAAPLLFAADTIADALQLIPYAMVSFGILAIAGIFLSTLDGFQRADLRNIILISGTVGYGLGIPVLVGRFGFVGLGYAQLLQSLYVLVMAWIIVRKQTGMTGWLPRHFDRSTFKEMLSYNVHLQFGTLAAFLGDPLAKVLLGHFGSLSMVGYFEMATKLVSQFRAIVVNVNQVLVPVIAQMQEQNREAIRHLYERTYALLFFVSVTFYGVLAVSLPWISDIWIGSYNPFFLGVGYAMLFAMQVNTLSGPAFFSNMGTGSVASNSISQVIIGASNAALGVTLGFFAGGGGVVVAYAVAVVAGSVFLLARFSNREGLSWRSLLPPAPRAHAAITLALVVTLGWFTWDRPDLDRLAHALFAGGGTLALMISAWCSPARKALPSLRRNPAA